MKILFITGNKGKFDEIREMIKDLEQIDIDLPEIQSLDPHEVLKAKLLHAQKHSSNAFIVEDTSFTIDGMNGLPGTLSKFFLKSIGNDGIVKLAQVFGSKAHARSMIGFSDQNQKISFFEGVLEGEIVDPTGETSRGFGWDPIFKPLGHDKTFGQMDSDEKNAVSMRKIAVEKLLQSLKTLA